MSDTIESLKDAEKEAMATTNYQKQVQRHRGNITGGLILVAIGSVFLLNQLTGWYIQNWWALFIFIPAILKLNDAWQTFQANGRWHEASRNSLLGGILLTMVGSFFLFNLSWNLFWPLVLILFGVCALLNGRS